MKVALVCPAPSKGSKVATYSSRLLPHLRDLRELEILETREPEPRDFDQIVYQVGNEPECAFIPPLVRRIGGDVVLHEWDRRALMQSLWPELEKGGIRRTLRVWREGGFGASSPLNRSIVRFADAFLVHDHDLARSIRLDRNAPTPVGILTPGTAEVDDWSRLAREYADILASFPAPRSKRRSLLRTIVESSANH